MYTVTTNKGIKYINVIKRATSDIDGFLKFIHTERREHLYIREELVDSIEGKPEK